MERFHLLKQILDICIICSGIIGIVCWILIYSILKNPKYDDKLVEELPLLKYLKLSVLLSILILLSLIAKIVLLFFDISLTIM